MSYIGNSNTISGLFYSITVDFGKSQTKPLLQYKDGGEYKDIGYTEVYENTELLALGLASMGVKRNDKIAIISENRPEWVYVDNAVLGLGGLDVPLYPILTSDTIEYSLNDSESKGIVVSTKFQLNKVLKIKDNCKKLEFIIIMNDEDVSEYSDVYTFAEIQQKGKEYGKENPDLFKESLSIANEDDLCTIIYTSGTTGEPKGVMLTHKNIISNVKAIHAIFDIGETDRFLSFLPMCHIFERMGGYYTAFSGGCTIAYAESIEKVAQNMGEIKPTIMTGVPRLFERMYSKIKRNVESQPEKKQKIFNWAIDVGRQHAAARKTEDSIPLALNLKHKLADKLVYKKLRERTGGRLRFFISGGAALARELGEFFEAAGILVIEGYGLTESSPVICCNRVNDYKYGTVGKPVPGVEVKIAKDGEILAYGPNIMVGYYNKKKDTEETIKNGWLHTGDVGVFDAEGFLVITDRKKSLFKTSGGKYIAPTPIENMFLTSKYIDQFIIIGDRRMFVTALIVPDFDALKEYADANRINYTDVMELTQMKQIYEMLENDLKAFQKSLANFERVRKFTILDKPFTIESGEMTPSLKLKRKVIEQRYENLIDDMYNEIKA